MKIENLKVGDVLIAIDECDMSSDGTDKRLTIGKEYKIITIRNNRFVIIDDEGESHSFIDIERFFKPKQFTKSDLKTGMRVEYRNENVKFVNTDFNLVTDKNGAWSRLTEFNDDFTSKYVYKRDIVKIYNIPESENEFINLNVKGTLLWERKEKDNSELLKQIEETEKQLLTLKNKLNE